jgi:hypothetical protein
MGKLKKWAYALGLTAVVLFALNKAYLQVLGGIAGYCAKNSHRINNETELAEKIENLQQSRNIAEDVRIEGYLYSKKDDEEFRRKFKLLRGTSDSTRDETFYFNEDGSNLIKLMRVDANECSLEHELDHIADGRLKRYSKIKNPFFKKIFEWYYLEPHAVVYSQWGVDL